MGARASEAVQVSNPPNVRIHLAYFCEGELYGELLKHLGRTMHDPDGLCVFAPWRESKESRYDGECHCLTQSRQDAKNNRYSQQSHVESRRARLHCALQPQACEKTRRESLRARAFEARREGCSPLAAHWREFSE